MMASVEKNACDAEDGVGSPKERRDVPAPRPTPRAGLPADLAPHAQRIALKLQRSSSQYGKERVVPATGGIHEAPPI